MYDWKHIRISETDEILVNTDYIPGGCRAFGPGRINYFFKFSGPSFSCDTACSSSLATIQAACTSLQNGDTDTVVAGGMNILTNSDPFSGLSNGHFLSKTPNACKTWDREADGYCRADGIGSIVMKRLEDAQADNDNILGVILASATNHSAEAISITHPHAGAQSDLYRKVMSEAGIDPLDVSYVEMHGTGTQAGDTVEIKSITDIFAPKVVGAGKHRSPEQPLHIGAVKSNVGHGEAVAGVTALIKVLLMFQKNMIPPHVGIKTAINPAFPKDLDERGLRIPYDAQPWSRQSNGQGRIAVVNNFSAAGGNTTLAIEDAPAYDEITLREWDEQSTYVVTVSAKSKASLLGNIERLAGYLDNHRDDLTLADLSYSTTARKTHYNRRVAVHASDLAQARTRLAGYLVPGSLDSHKAIPHAGPPQIAFAFTGQGASYKSMSLELFHNNSCFRSAILHLDSLAQSQGFPSLIPAIDGSHPSDYVHSPVITQLALVALQIALAKYWASLGVHPSVVVGHSLGEYAAMHVAGVLGASDAMYLVGSRARLLQESSECQSESRKMMAVRASVADIESVIGSPSSQSFEIACINGPKDTVVSGSEDCLKTIRGDLELHGFKCFTLDVAFAFHSAQMDPILDEFEETARDIVYHAPVLPVISPLLGKVIFDDKTLNAKYLRRATREPVNFLAAIEKAHDLSSVDPDTLWIEIGPHPVCLGFIKSILPSVNATVPSFRRDENNWTTLGTGLAMLYQAGVNIGWGELYRSCEKAYRLLDLPTYSWNAKNHWINYKGTWALTKGNTFYDSEKTTVVPTATRPHRKFLTSTVQEIVDENFDGADGSLLIQSNLMEADFLAAANGHRMNRCGVVTSVSRHAIHTMPRECRSWDANRCPLPCQSIHADIAYTIGTYMWEHLHPGTPVPCMDVSNLEVLKGLVAQKNSKVPQLIQVSARTDNTTSAGGTVQLDWSNVNSTASSVDVEPFASATLCYGSGDQWLKAWIPISHLVQERITALEVLAHQGVANRFSHNMAYLLFARNLVDYAPKYRGMQSVVLYGLEAFADITLAESSNDDSETGTWTVPPYYIDSVVHLAGFVMNVSDSIDTGANYCVTPGWGSLQFAKPLIGGAQYRSYVKMIPTAEDPAVYLGNVYNLQGGEVIGFVGSIEFRRYPRILLNRFFSAPDEAVAASFSATKSSSTAAEAPKLIQQSSQTSAPTERTKVIACDPMETDKSLAEPKVTATVDSAAPASNSIAARALDLIAKEAGLERAELLDESSFADLGIDSLMSLVISEKFREELGVAVSGSLFLEYPTIGNLKSWLLEYFS